MKPEAKYAELVASFRATPGLTSLSEGRGFGSTGQLKVDGRIFAMLVRDALVVKLPRARVDELVGGGEGTRFDAGKGTPMREWFVLSSGSRKSWKALANESLAFVAASGRSPASAAARAAGARPAGAPSSRTTRGRSG